MTTIQNIPEELLLDIFSNLSVRDLTHCQSVCQSWYIPARVKQLNNSVVLTSVAKVKRFITTMNKTPSSRFLAAVKEIEIRHRKDWNVTDTVLDKLFFRFPNLEKVTINETLLNSFDDNVCKTFLSHCPKLADLEVYELGPTNYQNLLNIRLLLTKLVLQRLDNVEQVVSNFPRLKSLYSCRWLNNFESLLTVLGHLTDLRLINIRGLVNTSDDFPERYLQTQTAKVRQQLLERISRINDLDLGRVDILSESVLLFISKYMTGLESIKIKTILPNDNPQQIHLLCTMFSVLRASNLCLITIHMPIDILWGCLPRFNQAFRTSTKGKELQIHVTGEYIPKIVVNTSKGAYMKIEIRDIHLHDLPVLFHGILEFDTFSLHVPSDERQHIRTYNAFFKSKSTLKEVTLHSPVRIVGTEMIDNVEQNHVSVKKLTIVSGPYATADVLLERCSIAFPNLRFMTLVGCCGTWRAGSKFHLELKKYTLEKLEIDLAPLYKDIRGQKFILVQVQIESLGDTYFYKVPFNRSEVTRVDDRDLKGLERKKDYVLVHVAIYSLKYLTMAHTHHSKTLGIKINTKLDIELVSAK